MWDLLLVLGLPLQYLILRNLRWVRIVERVAGTSPEAVGEASTENDPVTIGANLSHSTVRRPSVTVPTDGWPEFTIPQWCLTWCPWVDGVHGSRPPAPAVQASTFRRLEA
jgi:hypothetical protein